MARVRLRVLLGPQEHKLGPGKIRLLEAIAEHGSITAAARSMGMAYRHAWVLVDEMNRSFEEPVVDAAVGGRTGGGTRLTPWGEELVRRFHKMERAASRAIRAELEDLDARVVTRRRARSRRRDRPVR